MLNSVIVTVKIKNTGIEYDMELPANMPGLELCEKLLAALKNIEYSTFRDVEKININYNYDKYLGDGQNLEEAEIWDGSIINVLAGKQ